MQMKAIKEKIASVGNIQKITKTMEMVSVSKMRRTTKKAIAAQPCARFSASMLRHIADARPEKHVFIDGHTFDSQDGTQKTILLIIVASNKGLCGGYNVNVNREVSRIVNDYNDMHSFTTITIGRQAEKIAKRNGLEIDASYTDFSDSLSADDVRVLVNDVVTKYRENTSIEQVILAHTRFVKMMEYKATRSILLPLKDNQILDTYASQEEKGKEIKKKGVKQEYQFEPSIEAIIEKTVPYIIQTLMMHSVHEASASEHSSRMVAMQNASENAGRMKDDLKLSFNRARQAGITQEISEIINAAEAVT